MKKYLIYIIPAIMAIAIFLLFFTGGKDNGRKADQRVTLKKQDKIPYGTYLAYHSLPDLFPDAIISSENNEPGYWDSLSVNRSGQALIIVSGQFNADENEMNRLMAFIKKGNYVFISSREMSWKAKDMLKAIVNDLPAAEFNFKEDSLHVFLNEPPFNASKGYHYSGKMLDANFIEIDLNKSEKLGYNEKRQTNFIHLKAGNGHLFIHLAPLTLTNHFLLYRNNFDYYEQVFSVIPADVNRVVWDEYYLYKKLFENRGDKKNWFTVLSRYPGLKAALMTALFSLLIYVLLEMRRKQRFIPQYSRPRNDSLDFVKTIGRLYFDKGDNLNLAKKMGSYFLEHVRNKYQLPTNQLDDNFIDNLKNKSGAQASHIAEIVSFISRLDQSETMSDKQLARFHKQLEEFYKIT